MRRKSPFLYSLAFASIIGALLGVLGAWAQRAETIFDRPSVPQSKRIEENRFETSYDFASARRWLRKQLDKNGISHTQQRLVNQPGVKAVHFRSGEPKTKWEGVNLYQINQVVRYYIIMREEEKPKGEKPRNEKGTEKGGERTDGRKP